MFWKILYWTIMKNIKNSFQPTGPSSMFIDDQQLIKIMQWIS